jgi:hypothetical protein
LVLLGFRYWDARGGASAPRERGVLGTLLILQTCVTFAVARADADTADSYRDFAATARSRIGPAPGASVWFLGHWGWMHYAEQAGFRMLHVTGPFPADGDVVIVPRYVDKGHVLERLPAVAASLHQLDEIAYPDLDPIRTVHPSGAGFYALFTRRGPGRASRVPYRYEPRAPLEIFDVYAVRSGDVPPR